ncbi:MAG TPA: glycosyltransferase family 2 protein [Thermoplasmata archaeon]|nr:glycosyltransferase family 2 protein [Thermoplasmata archaeon]
MSGTPTPPALWGGVVAFNERNRIAAAIKSLLAQVLPDGSFWMGLTVVVSGSTDGTETIVRELSERDPRVRLVVQKEREGKSSALAEVFRRAQGDYLILLNGDACAAPGAVRALLEVAQPPGDRFAVMGRPLPPRGKPGRFSFAISMLWSIHHSVHATLLAEGSGNHLSDELMLLPVRELPPLGPGIINDGSFVGGWLSQHRGELRYAPDAVATISAPRTFREHVRQRRRIVFGHRQIRNELALEPLTLARYARKSPRKALRILAASTRRTGGILAFATLLAGEAIAGTLALVDSRSSRQDHIRWNPIGGHLPDGIGEPARAGLTAEGS